MNNVIKRNGDVVPFDKNKIYKAVYRACTEVKCNIEETEALSAEITIIVFETLSAYDKDSVSVEEIQDLVEIELMRLNSKVARAYVRYRYDREKNRALSSDLEKRYDQLVSLVKGTDEESKKENSNKDTRILPTMRDYIAGFTCREVASKLLLPKDIQEAHENGIIHFHDTDYSPAMPITNCCLINLEDMLQNGTVISETMIEKPHSFRTACTITTQIITQVASSQYGGSTISLAHLAPFVDISRKRYKEKYKNFSDEDIENLVKEEVRDGIQTIQYQLITMSTTNGQAPFVSIFMYINEVENKQTKDDLVMIIEEVLNQRIKGVKNKNGVYITTAFPKLLYVLDENNINEDSEYWYLTKLAAECSSKRLVPDYISAKKMRELKEGNVFPCMGCRSFLMPYYQPNGTPKHYGRFNQGVVTLSLPDIALSSNGDIDKFWEIFNERLNLCYKALMIRHKSLIGTKSDVAPILWQHGAYARLMEGELIDRLLFNNYSSISLGYAGLYECVKYMTDESQLEEIGYEFGLKIMKHLYNTCEKWQNETNIGFSLYGTPIESTTYKFAKCLKNRFGIIKGITDKDYITNSYHISPNQKIDAFSKLSVESDFSKYSSGGQISYIETPNMTNNIDALLEVIKHIYNTNMYAEINTMTSYCQCCGGKDIKLVKKENNDFEFICPECQNNDFDKMNVALRICGYISTNPFNNGRANDIYDRVYHLGDE